jgi:serine/threonine protein kinase
MFFLILLQALSESCRFWMEAGGRCRLHNYSFVYGSQHGSDYHNNTRTASPLYMPPEIIGGRHYSNQMDVFSFGALLYETVRGKQPNQDVEDNMDDVYQLYGKGLAGAQENPG